MAMRRPMFMLLALTVTAVLLWLVLARADNDQQQQFENASLTPLGGCPDGGAGDQSEFRNKGSSSEQIVLVSALSSRSTIKVGTYTVNSGGGDMAMYMIN